MKKATLFSLIAVAVLSFSFSQCDTTSGGTLKLQIVLSENRAGTIPEQVQRLYIGVYTEEVLSGNLYAIYQMAPLHVASITVPEGVPLHIVMLATNPEGRAIIEGSTSEPVSVGGEEESVAYITANFLASQTEPGAYFSLSASEPAATTFDVAWTKPMGTFNASTMTYTLNRAIVPSGDTLDAGDWVEAIQTDSDVFLDPEAANHGGEWFEVYYNFTITYDDFNIESVEIDTGYMSVDWAT